MARASLVNNLEIDMTTAPTHDLAAKPSDFATDLQTLLERVGLPSSEWQKLYKWMATPLFELDRDKAPKQ